MSSRRLFAFSCVEGHESEALVYPDTQEIHCRQCGEPAQRIITPVRSKLEGISGDFPTAYANWSKVHEQANRVARKRVEGRTQYDD